MSKIVSKPWGYEKIFADTEHYLGKVLVINPGQKLSRQYHNVKDETFMVLSGTLTLEIGSGSDITTFTLGEGASYHCSPLTVHRLINDDKLNVWAVQVVEVSSNPSTEKEDLVRLEDEYKRQ